MMLRRDVALLIGGVTVTLVTLFLAGSASAYPADYVDIDGVGEWMTPGETVSGNFNITLSNRDGGDDFAAGSGNANLADVVGFDPLAEDISAARVSFLFFDRDFAYEGIEIDLTGLVGGDTIVTQVVVVKLLTIDADVSVLAALNQDGQLDWSITADDSVKGNDFYVALARLEAITDRASTSGIPGPGGSPVPEPGSTALLAVGTLVVARAGRRRRR